MGLLREVLHQGHDLRPGEVRLGAHAGGDLQEGVGLGDGPGGGLLEDLLGLGDDLELLVARGHGGVVVRGGGHAAGLRLGELVLAGLELDDGLLEVALGGGLALLGGSLGGLLLGEVLYIIVCVYIYIYIYICVVHIY